MLGARAARSFEAQARATRPAAMTAGERSLENEQATLPEGSRWGGVALIAALLALRVWHRMRRSDRL